MNVGCVIGDVKMQVKLALPIVLTNVLNLSRLSVSLMFVGHLTKHVFAGTALDTSFALVSGFSMMIGLSSALDTFCGQAFGAKEEASVGVHTQRAMLVLTALCIPISIAWIFTEPILIFIRQNQEISIEAAAYIRWLIPGLFGFVLGQCQTRFLNNQRIVIPLMLSSFLSSLFHVPLCWLLVFKSGLGNKGAAIALSISYWFNAILLALYIKFSSTCKATWKEFSRDAFHHVPQFLKLAASSALMLCLKFWTLELLVLLCGLLPNPELETSAFSITRNITSIATMISLGIRVSNELGAGCPKEADYLLHSYFGRFGHLITSGLVKKRMGNYSNEREVAKYVANMMPLVAISHLLDSTQCLFAGILRGCGLQRTGAIINLGAFYITGVPLSIVLGFIVHMRAKGFWIGFICALCIQVFLYGILIFCVNWENLTKS